MISRAAIGAVATGTAAFAISSTAHAHAFAARYDLPIPLNLYLWGAGGAVVLSFAILALSKGPSTTSADTADRSLATFWIPRRLVGFLDYALGLLGVMMFATILVAGYFGQQSPLKNIGPVTVWVIWWVGFVYCVALVGNLWPTLNPWRQLARLAASFWSISPPFSLKDSWLALPLFLLFAWTELVWPHSEQPAQLATVILVYSLICWTGMALFGRETWLRHGEIFSIFFSVIGRFSPLVLQSRSGRTNLVFRPWAAGLLTEKPMSPAMTVFIITMLATVTFDGFLETPAWHDLKAFAFSIEGLAPIWFWLRDLTGDHHAAFQTMGLIAFPAFFYFAFRLTCYAMRRLGRSGSGSLSGWFVLSLVPIAIAYHFSHYLSYLLIAGQMIIPAISDPLGLGWNLFGTTDYRIDIAIINAKTVWYVSVVAIVTGHVIAVYLAHVMAARLFASAKHLVLSQIPMLMLMIGYTVISLWILAQPIVEG